MKLNSRTCAYLRSDDNSEDGLEFVNCPLISDCDCVLFECELDYDHDIGEFIRLPDCKNSGDILVIKIKKGNYK